MVQIMKVDNLKFLKGERRRFKNVKVDGLEFFTLIQDRPL